MLRNEKYTVVNDILSQMTARKHWLPGTKTSEGILSRGRLSVLNRRNLIPSPAEMNDILKRLNYPRDLLKQECEKEGNEELRYYYWDILYPDNEPKERVSLVIDQIIHANNSSCSDLSRRINTSSSFVIANVNGYEPISYRFLERLAAAYKIPMKNILKELQPDAEVTKARNDFKQLFAICIAEKQMMAYEICTLIDIKPKTYESLVNAKSRFKASVLDKFEKVFTTETVARLKELAIKGNLIKNTTVAISKNYNNKSLESLFQYILGYNTIKCDINNKKWNIRPDNLIILLKMILDNDYNCQKRNLAMIRYYLVNIRSEENLAQRLRTHDTSTEQYVYLKDLYKFSYEDLRQESRYSLSGMSGCITQKKGIPFDLAWRTTQMLGFPICLAYDDAILRADKEDIESIKLSDIKILLETKEEWEYQIPSPSPNGKYTTYNIPAETLIKIIDSIICSKDTPKQIQILEQTVSLAIAKLNKEN